jgi:hypothetical protein
MTGLDDLDAALADVALAIEVARRRIHEQLTKEQG